MRSKTELVWLPVVNNDFWWTNYVQGIKLTSVDGDSQEFQIVKSYAMTDTGTSCVYLPTAYYYSLMNLIFSGVPEAVYNRHYDEIDVPCS